MANKIVVVFLLTILILLFLCTYVNANVEGFIEYYKPNNYKTITDDNDDFMSKAGIILGWVKYIGIAVATITIAIIGIKYMFGSIEDKAEYKKTIMPYLIGCFLLVATPTILQTFTGEYEKSYSEMDAEEKAKVDVSKLSDDEKRLEYMLHGVDSLSRKYGKEELSEYEKQLYVKIGSGIRRRRNHIIGGNKTTFTRQMYGKIFCDYCGNKLTGTGNEFTEYKCNNCGTEIYGLKKFLEEKPQYKNTRENVRYWDKNIIDMDDEQLRLLYIGMKSRNNFEEEYFDFCSEEEARYALVRQEISMRGIEMDRRLNHSLDVNGKKMATLYLEKDAYYIKDYEYEYIGVAVYCEACNNIINHQLGSDYKIYTEANCAVCGLEIYNEFNEL